MHLKTAMCGEVLVTNITFKLFNPSVSTDMRVQSTLHSKGTETLYTLVGFLVGVDTRVTHKITGFLELLGTE